MSTKGFLNANGCVITTGEMAEQFKAKAEMIKRQAECIIVCHTLIDFCFLGSFK